MSFLDNLSPEDLIFLTNALAISLSKDKNAAEVNAIGNFVVGVGCLMLTIAAQQEYIALQKQKNNKANPQEDPEVR